MKYCETLLDYVRRDISNVDVQRKQHQNKMTNDFNYAFEWSLCEELYCLNYQKSLLERLQNVIIEEELSINVLNYLFRTMETYLNEVKRGDFMKHSTNIYSNIAHTLKLEENMKFVKTCERYSEYLRGDGAMQLK